MNDPSYRSLLVRFWREPDGPGEMWRGEVEHIQSGIVVAVASLEEALALIRRVLVGEDKRDGETFDCHSER